VATVTTLTDQWKYLR